MRLTTNQAIEQELYQLGEALGNCLELNEDFIDRYCGASIAGQLLRIDEVDREFALQGCIDGGIDGGYCGLSNNTIILPVGEIEVQIESEDDLEDPDDWVINGDLAYATMVSARFVVDVEMLTVNINDILEDNVLT